MKGCGRARVPGDDADARGALRGARGTVPGGGEPLCLVEEGPRDSYEGSRLLAVTTLDASLDVSRCLA